MQGQRLLLAVLIASALLAVASADKATAAARQEPDMAGGPRWGFFRLRRLRSKLKEIHADLGESRHELHRLVLWGKSHCLLTRGIYNKRVVRAESTLKEWRDILKMREALAKFHTSRHHHHRSRHLYARFGPKSRRKFVHKCRANRRHSLKHCKRHWCRKHHRACDRWHEARRHYFRSRLHVHLAHHRHVTLDAQQRVVNARRLVKRAARRVGDLRRARMEALHSCGGHVRRLLAHFKARVVFFENAVKAYVRAIKHLVAQRKHREASYKPFYMTKCKHLGGEHHAYNCVLDAHNRDRAHHRFTFCRHRGRPSRELHSLQFRCYK